MNNITEIAVVADRSGSMSRMIDESRNSINRLIDEQRDVEGKANFTFVMFDDIYEVIHNRVDIQKAGLIGNEYNARGTTALYDAVGKTINTIQEGLDKTPAEDRADKVMIAIVTDGDENASKEYTHPQIAELIKLKESQGWEFLFFGANIDAKSVAVSLNIPVRNAVQYSADDEGATLAYSSMTDAMTSYRSSTSDVRSADLREQVGGNS